MPSFSVLKILSMWILNLMKISGFLDKLSFIIIHKKCNALVTFLMIQFLLVVTASLALNKQLMFKTLAKSLDGKAVWCYDHGGLLHGYDNLWFLEFQVVFSILPPFIMVFIKLFINSSNISVFL